METFASGERQIDAGSHDTIMIGIACGEVALLSERLLYPYAHSAMTIDDDTAKNVMRAFAKGGATGDSVVVGETGAAGIAGLLRAATHDELRDAIGLNADSRVLLINSEGDTAVDVYRAIIDAST